MLYLDASVIVPLLVPEPSSDYLLQWVATRADWLCTGRLAVGEAGSAISRKQRENRLTAEEGHDALIALDAWLQRSVVIVDHLPSDIAEAAMLVRRPLPKLLMPDAIHLATSRRLKYRFVTADRKLVPVLDLHQVDWVSPS